MAQIQVRRDTAANWTTANTTLASGEIGFETDTGRFKIGRSSTAWTALAYTEGITGFNGRTGNVSLTSSDVTTALAYTPLAPLGNVTHANSTAVANDTAYIRGETYQSGSLQVYYGASASGASIEPDSFRAGAACGTRDLYFRTVGSTTSLGSSLFTGNASATVQAGLSSLYNACMSVTGGDSYTGLTARVQAINTKTAVGSITGNIAVSKFAVIYNSDAPELTLATNGTNSQALLTVPSALPVVYTANSILTQGYADTRYSAANHTHTYANITDKPTLANVATSGSYLDLSNTPTAYSLPTATTSVLGGVKVDGSSVTISNGTISVSTAYAGTGANSFTGAQNLQDNELIRAKIRDYSETVSSPTISAGTLTLNLETSNIFTVSLNAAITTLTISNPPASGSGGSFTLIFTADGTARAVTWPASIKWAGGTAPTLTSTSGKVDSFAFFSSDGGTTWQGYVGGQNF